MVLRVLAFLPPWARVPRSRSAVTIGRAGLELRETGSGRALPVYHADPEEAEPHRDDEALSPNVAMLYYPWRGRAQMSAPTRVGGAYGPTGSAHSRVRHERQVREVRRTVWMLYVPIHGQPYLQVESLYVVYSRRSSRQEGIQ
jgi:hypothetical protein